MVIELHESPQIALQELHKQDDHLLSWVQACKVTDPASQKNTENMLISAKFAFKRADAKRRELLKPLEQTVDGINGLFKPYLERLKGAIDHMQASLTEYHKDCQELAREEQQKLLIDQAQAIANARVTGEVVELPAAASVVAAPAKTNHADMGTVTYRKELCVEIVEPALVPRDLCEPSMTKIRARVKSGMVDIPGVLVSEKLVPVARRLT